MSIPVNNPQISLSNNIGCPIVYYLADGTAIFGVVTNPEGVVTAYPGSFAIGVRGSAVEGKWYRKNSGDGATDWIDMTSGGGGSGTVTSVGLTMPTSEFNVASSPVTTSGTIAVTWDNQNQNLVLSSPDGTSGQPSFRGLVANDIPTLPVTKLSFVGNGNIIIGSGGANTTTALVGGSTNSLQYNSGALVLDGSSEITVDPATATLQLGANAGSRGRIQLFGGTSNHIFIRPADAGAIQTFILPDALPADNTRYLKVASIAGSTTTFEYGVPAGGGAVSSVSNADGTLTISPTTGAVVASLNLSNANTWLANQTLGSGLLRATSPRITTSILDNAGLDILRLSPLGSATQSLQIANAIVGGNITLIANAPASASASQVGTSIRIEASNATAGTSSPSVAVGGGLYLKAGDAASFSSSTDQRGGDIELVYGASVGTNASTQRAQLILPTNARYNNPSVCFRARGGAGLQRAFGFGMEDGMSVFLINGNNTISLCVGDSAIGLSTGYVLMNNRTHVAWVSGTSNPHDFSADTSLIRAAAAVIRASNGSTGAGKLLAAQNGTTAQGFVHSEPDNTSFPAYYANLPSGSTQNIFTGNNNNNSRFIVSSGGKITGSLNNTIQNFRAGGQLFTTVSDLANSGTGITTLASNTLPANSISATGDVVELESVVEFANNANNKSFRLTLGSTQLFTTGLIGLSNSVGVLKVKIYRTGSAAQRYIAVWTSNDVLLPSSIQYGTAVEDWTTSLTISTSAQGGATNDITQRLWEGSIALA